MNRTALPIAVSVLALIAMPMGAGAKPRAKSAQTVPVIRGDAAAGAELFKARCAVCHGKQGEGAALAPPLLGVVGSKAASSPFAGYTAALKGAGLTWSPTALDTFLAGPGKMVPGTAMMVAIPKADDRQNLVAYLATLKK